MAEPPGNRDRARGPAADLDPRQTKAFDFAAEFAKQLITLSTGIVAITITFRQGILGGGDKGDTVLLGLAWLALTLSILCGVGLLMSMTGHLAKRPASTIYEFGVRAWAIGQTVTFLVGIVLTVSFGFTSL